MDKHELIKAIDEKETLRLLDLDDKDLKNEYIEWFQIVDDPTEDRTEMLNDLHKDFMKYREDDSVEELQEKLTQY